MPNAPAKTNSAPANGLDPGAGVLALLVPGMGYVVRSERGRAVRLVVGLGVLTVLGLLIGGLDAVDREKDFYWFWAQAGLGPLAWGLVWLRAGFGGAPSIGWANEIGRLFVVLAGMCNAIAVLDCLMPTIRDDDAEKSGEGGGS
ncbi:MAG: DUF6677 family protein [Planctomycetota bacterium]